MDSDPIGTSSKIALSFIKHETHARDKYEMAVIKLFNQTIFYTYRPQMHCRFRQHFSSSIFRKAPRKIFGSTKVHYHHHFQKHYASISVCCFFFLISLIWFVWLEFKHPKFQLTQIYKIKQNGLHERVVFSPFV